MTQLNGLLLDQKVIVISLSLICIVLWLFFSQAYSASHHATQNKSTAFFYGSSMPLELLAHFEQVIVEPEYLRNPDRLTQQGVSVYAYVSVGEANPTRTWYPEIQKSWFLGSNPDWGTDVLDMTSSGWSNYLLINVLTPLWKQGYRGFFLDTLDSYQSVLKNHDDLLAQEQALIQLIKAIHKRFPGVKIMLNRGFELLPQVGKLVTGVAAESLFQGWDPKTRKYRAVLESDRAWLLQRLNEVREKYQLQVLAIDYVSPMQRELARETAKRIAALGFTPWVANPSLDMLGIGSIEVYPRQILAIYDSHEYPHGLKSTHLHRLLAMPVEYLGYTLTYRDIRHGLPDHDLSGQYAGIVTWLGSDAINLQGYEDWLLQRFDEGLKVLILGKLGFIASEAFRQRMGMASVEKELRQPVTIEKDDAIIGFEAAPAARLNGLTAWRAVQNEIIRHLSLVDQSGQKADPVVSGPWGGMAIDPFVFETGLSGAEKWIINPFELLTRALQLPRIPVPDVTTENGRRLLLIQISGEGTADSSVSMRAIYDQIINPYNLPSTVSINRGEAPVAGIFSKQARQIDKYARKIFCRREIEIASAPYVHAGPGGAKQTEKIWDDKTQNTVSGHGKIAINDLKGALDYVNKHWAPAGKSARVFSVTGHGPVNPGTLAWARSRGMEIISSDGAAARINSTPTITKIPPTGLPEEGFYQVYAPATIGLDYTNHWHEPYSGFKQVMEMIKFTDSPRRLKPIHLHYPFNAGSNVVVLNALKEVYQWVLGQTVRPVWLSEYAQKVNDFQTVTLAHRLKGGWEIRGLNALRTLRIPDEFGWPDLERSQGVTGVRHLPQGRYVSLLPNKGRAQLFLNQEAPARPYLLHTNGMVEQWVPNHDGILFRITAVNRLEVVIATRDAHCQVRWKGGKIDGQQESDAMRFIFPATGSGKARLVCKD